MSFASEFLSYFTSEEQDSELVSILTLIGSNAELALSQELTLFALQATDYSLYSEDQLRSLLAYLLVPVPNKTSALGTAHILIDYSSGAVSIPVDKIVMDANGRQWLSKDSLYLRSGEEADFTVLQGEEVSVSGTYSEFISIPAPDVDLSYISLFLDGVDIPQLGVSYERFIPIDGFFAFIYNGILYIRVFPGDTVADPEGASYVLTYFTTDGLQGNILANQMTSFLDTIYDENNEPVQYTISNLAITNGTNAPTKYKLFNYLRYWFFVKDSVSSIPEYKIFFLSQPELGDCFVEGDYERYKRTGVLTVTGKVEAVLMRNTPDPTYGYHVFTDTVLLNLIEARLAAVRDISITIYDDFGEVTHNYLVRFISALDTETFVNSVKTAIINSYSLSYCREFGVSLFDGFDISLITDQLDRSLLYKGLEIIPFFYKEVPVTDTTLVINTYPNIVEAQTTYTYRYTDGTEFTFDLIELKDTDGVVKIYLSTDLSTSIGIHDYSTQTNAITIGWAELSHGGTMEISFLMSDRSFIRVGEAKSIRVVGDITVEPYTI